MLVGWDRATETHDVTVIDGAGARIARTPAAGLAGTAVLNP